MTISQTMSQFITRTSFTDLSQEAIEAVKFRVLDLLGVTMLGYQLGEHRKVYSNEYF